MDENRIRETRPIRGESAYLYSFKNRARRHHCLGYGIFSVDLTKLEEARKAYSRAVRPITYKPLLIKATALAVRETPEANAILFRRWLGLQVVQFENVDVNFPVTRELGERTITYVATIRDPAVKSLSKIQDELRHFQRASPEECSALRRFERFANAPLWLARLIHWWMTRSSKFYVQNVGTCGLTFSEYDEAGQFFPIAPTSIVFGVGGSCCEPVVRDDRVEITRQLHCSLMVDNFVISGIAGVQLVKDFKRVLEDPSFVWDEIQQDTAPTIEQP